MRLWTGHTQQNICLGVCLQNTHTFVSRQQNDFPLIMRWGVSHNPIVLIMRLWICLFHISKNTCNFHWFALQILKMRLNSVHRTSVSHSELIWSWSTPKPRYNYTSHESSHFQGSRSVSLCEGGSLGNPNSDGMGSLAVTVESIRATADTPESQRVTGFPAVRPFSALKNLPSHRD